MDEELAREMEAKGMVRADLLHQLGSAQAASVKEEQKGASDGKDEGESAPWDIDITKVQCTNMMASGAFGSVYHGLYKGNDVAVKFLNLPAALGESEMLQLQEGFRKEVIVWHGLNHPNIVQFHGASLTSTVVKLPGVELGGQMGHPPNVPIWAIVTEYISGGTLKAFLAKRRERLPLDEVINMALDIARGMQYLHARRIVHRDLKSENLLLAGKTVKIADFGVARIEAANPVDMTNETGTVRWMAPEIIDHKPYTRKVDVYSFGIVLWELFTGDHPFKDLSFVQLAYAVVNKGLRPEIPSDCPAELSTIIERSWHQDPNKRPDFQEVVRSLELLEAAVNQGTLVSNAKGSKKRGGCQCSIL